MKKRLIATLGFLVVGLLICTSNAFAGPPDETFGSIVSEYAGDQVIFNAFELGPVTADRCRGKGNVIYTVQRSGNTFVYYIDVEYANIQPDIGQAWFAGIVTRTTLNGEDDDTNVGRWFDIVAWDGGEGPGFDGLSGNWVDEGTWPDPEEGAKTRVCEEDYKAFGPIISGDIVIQIHPPGQRKK